MSHSLSNTSPANLPMICDLGIVGWPPSPSAAARALTIPEVLGMTFSLCEKPTLGASSAVSTFWSDVVIAHLWEELDTIIPLLKLLAPMMHVSIEDREGYRLGAWGCTGDPADFKWDRFSHYAHHVKKLIASETTTIPVIQNSTVTESTWTSILSTQPPGTVLFPHLKSLHLGLSNRFDLHSVLPLVSPGLLELSLSLAPETPPAAVRKFLQPFIHRTADLQSLLLRSTCPASEVSPILANWITQTPKLKDVTLPRFYHTKEVVRALGRLESLEALWADYVLRQEYQEDGTLFGITGRAFPKLKRVALNVASLRAVQILRAAPSWSRITEFGLSWQRRWDPGELLQFIDAFSSVCVNVTELSLNLFTQNIDATFQIEFNHLRPLLKCPHLTMLDISHNLPFNLKIADVEEMGKAWPELEYLSLCPDPSADFIDVGSGTSIQVLPSLAARLPKLKELGFYFDEEAPFTFDGDLNPAVQFAHLRVLNAGISSAPGEDFAAVAFFLGALCRCELEIVYGASGWHVDGMITRHKGTETEWEKIAAVVAKLVFCKTKAGQDA